MKLKILCVPVMLCSLLFSPTQGYAQKRFSSLVGDVQVGEVQPGGALEVPFITWGGDVATFYANGGLKTKAGTLFGGHGLNLNLVAGDELQVRAPVINVEALKEPATEIEYCDGHPGEAAGLIDLLSWDLGLDCERELVESTSCGYRVSYRWDDRVYSQIMDSDPGSSIALKVRLD